MKSACYISSHGKCIHTWSQEEALLDTILLLDTYRKGMYIEWIIMWGTLTILLDNGISTDFIKTISLDFNIYITLL